MRERGCALGCCEPRLGGCEHLYLQTKNNASRPFTVLESLIRRKSSALTALPALPRPSSGYQSPLSVWSTGSANGSSPRMAWRFAKPRGKHLSVHTPSRLVSFSWSQTLFPTIVLPTILKFPEERGFGFTQAAHCSSVKAAWARCVCWILGPANSASSKLAYSRTWPLWSNVSSRRARRVRPLASGPAVVHSSWTGRAPTWARLRASKTFDRGPRSHRFWP